MTKARENSDYTGLQGDLALKSPVASPVFTGNVSHGDNVKAKFGTGNDLEIFHDGSHSRIKDVGTGHLVLSGGEVHFNDSSNTSNHLAINANGAVTKPLQPAFQAIATSTQRNKIPTQQHTILFAGEIFDNNNNFSSNTFTAPVTGKYYLTTNVRLDNLDISASYYQLWMTTSNRNYVTILAMNGFDADVTLYTLTLNVLADMDAGDTAFINFNQYGGAAQTDIDGDGKYTNFSGYLVA
jgi:hypothetical protein